MLTEERTASSPDEGDLAERWSAKRKTEIVLRLLRGEALDQGSREVQVPAHLRETWQRRFLDGGHRGLRTRRDPEERELTLGGRRTATQPTTGRLSPIGRR